MFRVVRHSSKQPRLDLKTVRETLLYIESDCRACPGLESVAAAIGNTISEIDRVSETAHSEPQPVVSVRFIPAGL